MKVHVNIRVSGRVQNIGFRYSTLEVATKMNILGFVQNLSDGSVYIEAEGEDKDIERFMEWCQHGPPWAKVEKIHIEKANWVGYTDFQIKRS